MSRAKRYDARQMHGSPTGITGVFDQPTADLRGGRLLLVVLLFSIVFGSILHLAFSWIGFNPSDDGFVLAFSRRILNGEIPHRDFITVRPAGSPLLHAIWLPIAGHHAILASRFVAWCQFCAIGLAWVLIASTLLGRSLKLWHALSLAAIAAVMGIHTYQIMVWHTYDGIFFASMGLLLVTRRTRAGTIAGFVLLGLAPLCKQNFLPMALMSVVMIRRPRDVWQWFFTATGPVVYLMFITFHGGWRDMAMQLSAPSGLYRVGVAPYLSNIPMFAGVLSGCVAAWISLRGAARATGAKAWGMAMLAGWSLIILEAVWLAVDATSLNPQKWGFGAAWIIFGFAAGMGAVCCVATGFRGDTCRAISLALVLAWCGGLSDGYTNPSLSSGPLLAVIAVSLAFSGAGQTDAWPAAGRVMWSRIANAMPLIAMVLTLTCFTFARRTAVYRDLPVEDLTQPAGEVCAAAEGIWTNALTHDVLGDLQAAIAMRRHADYAVLPDVAAHWIATDRRNPLPIDWALNFEFGYQSVFAKLTRRVDQIRGKTTFVFAKVRIDSLSLGLVGQEYVLNYQGVGAIRKRLTKVGETRYFELYE